MDPYQTALVCRRGHVETWAIPRPVLWNSPGVVDAPGPSHCSECGQPLLNKCPACGHRIRGWRRGASSVRHTPVLPDFCDHCGAPYPWASRKARIYELENLLEADQSVDEATRLKAREELHALAENPDDDEAVESARWLRVKNLWPEVVKAGFNILTSVATAEAKRKLGLPQ